MDKYSKKCQRRGLREGRSRRKNEVSTSSADNSPLSSSTEQINLSRPSNLRDYDEEQLRSYLWCRRGLRRRSISSSPPRVRTSDSSNFRETQSQSGSPLISPSPSAGPSSPASGRYRKTTFATILNSATKRKLYIKGYLLIHLQEDVRLTKRENRKAFATLALPKKMRSCCLPVYAYVQSSVNTFIVRKTISVLFNRWARCTLGCTKNVKGAPLRKGTSRVHYKLTNYLRRTFFKILNKNVP